jgi:hypothetical protein
MSLDPTISLQATQPPPIDWTKYASLTNQTNATNQSIAASKAQQANNEASLPGIQANSQMAQFDAQKQADIKSIVASNTKLNDDGTTTVDMPKAIESVAKAGYIQDAQGLYANHFANAAAQASSVESKKNVRDHLFDSTVTLAKIMNDQNPGSGDAFAATSFSNFHKVPDIQASVGDDPRFKVKGASDPTTVSTPGAPTGGTGPDGTPQLGPVTTTTTQHPGVPAVPVDAGLKSTMAPADQWQVDAANPNSTLSKAVAAKTGVVGLPATGAVQVPGAVAQVNANINSNTLPADVRANAARELPVLSGWQSAANAGTAAANALLQDKGVLQAVAPTDSVAIAAGKLAGDGRIIALMRAITAANNDPSNPAKIDVQHVSIPDAQAALNQWNANLGQRVLANQGIQKNTQVGAVQTPGPAPGTQPTATRQPAQQGNSQTNPTQVTTRAAYDALAKGTWYMKDGKTYQKQ